MRDDCIGLPHAGAGARAGMVRRRDARANLLFSLSAVTPPVLAGCELWMMHAATPAAFGMALRWLHGPIWVNVVSMVGFVRLHLRAGRFWFRLVGLRCADALADPEFCFHPESQLSGVHLPATRLFFGETVAIAEPWDAYRPVEPSVCA